MASTNNNNNNINNNNDSRRNTVSSDKDQHRNSNSSGGRGGGSPRKNSTFTQFDAEDLSEEQILEIKEAFSIFDADGDGVITQKEFYKALEVLGSPLTETEAQQALQEMDVDENGRVDFTEFLTCVATKLQDEASEEEIVQAFKIFDIDNSGTISADEFKRIMMNMGQKMEESEVNEMLQAADSNGDGVIDYKEFAKMLDGGRGVVSPIAHAVLPDK